MSLLIHYYLNLWFSQGLGYTQSTILFPIEILIEQFNKITILS